MDITDNQAIFTGCSHAKAVGGPLHDAAGVFEEFREVEQFGAAQRRFGATHSANVKDGIRWGLWLLSMRHRGHWYQVLRSSKLCCSGRALRSVHNTKQKTKTKNKF